MAEEGQVVNESCFHVRHTLTVRAFKCRKIGGVTVGILHSRIIILYKHSLCSLTSALLLMRQPITLHYCCDIKSGLNYYYIVYTIIAALTAASFFFLSIYHIVLSSYYITGSVVNRESCNVSFIVTFPDYVYLYDVCDSENKLLTYRNAIILHIIKHHDNTK